MQKIIIFISICIFLTGCSLFHKDSQGVVPAKAQVRFVSDGKVLDAGRLRKGGQLLVVPFSPGPDVTASDEVDKVALRIVKGVSDGLRQDGSNIFVLGDTGAETADFLLEGRIIRQEEPGRMKRWVLRRRWRALAVEAKLIDPKTGQVIAQVSHQKSGRGDQASYENLGEKIGQDVGRFLAAQQAF
ncbi:MAG: hypothetical protein Q8Q08_12195 [Candidatus Omnitrophota bacterium]|nr:hypothetical protein [Candidatus Omnitrophota bacterium]MDZ4243455.1 hypothetical protein [Candidatus Omnitrophota bacterium]